MFASVKDTTAPTLNNLFLVATAEVPARNVKLAITRNALRTELDLLAEIVEAKQAYALFHHLLLEANTERVRLRAIGLYNTLQCDVEANVQQAGSLCLRPKNSPTLCAICPRQ